MLTLETLNTLALTSSFHWNLPFALCLPTLGSLTLLTSCPLQLASSKLRSIPSAKPARSANLFWHVSSLRWTPGRIPSPSAGRVLNHTGTVKMLLWEKEEEIIYCSFKWCFNSPIVLLNKMIKLVIQKLPSTSACFLGLCLHFWWPSRSSGEPWGRL